MKTKIVNLKNDNYTLYIGRKNTHYGLMESKWHNPIKLREDTPEERKRVLLEYEEYLLSREDLMEDIFELENQILGCWCKPKECHGDVLIRILNEKRLERMLINS